MLGLRFTSENSRHAWAAFGVGLLYLGVLAAWVITLIFMGKTWALLYSEEVLLPDWYCAVWVVGVFGSAGLGQSAYQLGKWDQRRKGTK